MPSPVYRLALALLIAGFSALPAQAQRYGQYARAHVESVRVLGMGGSGVALDGPETAFFYNPAHFASVGLLRPRVEILGVRAQLNTKFFSDLAFFRDRVQPALEDGFSFPLTQEDRELFEDALVQGRRPTVGQAAAMLPSVMLGVGPYGLGGGVFAQNTTRYRFEDTGTGVPVLDLFSQLDAIVALGGGGRVPGSNLSAGLTGKYVRRYIGYKNKDFLAIDPDAEQVYIVSGSTIAFDLGLQYEDAVASLPGSLDLGLAVYDLVGGGFDYGYYDAIDLTGGGEEDAREVERILEAFEDRDGSPSFRVGAAYRVPALAALGGLQNVSVALDYVSRSTSESSQPFLSKFRLGAEARVAGLVALRAGVSQGYPTIGAGLHTPFFRLDYVFYGVEDGRLPGQLERYNHLLQLRFGLF